MTNPDDKELTMKLTRICPGEYQTRDGEITVSRIDFGYGPEWLVAGPDFALDPMPTLSECRKAIAELTR